MNQSALSPKLPKGFKLEEDSPKMRSSMRQESGINRGIKTVTERKTVQAKNTLMLNEMKQPADRKLTF